LFFVDGFNSQQGMGHKGGKQLLWVKLVYTLQQHHLGILLHLEEGGILAVHLFQQLIFITWQVTLGSYCLSINLVIHLVQRHLEIR
jgi:hypothetical protein